MESIYIIDAVNYLFRSYYAIGPMTNDKGQSTSALYGFIRSLLKLKKDFSPHYLVAVFDGPNSRQSRQEVYREYKMQRKRAPEDLYPQMKLAFDMCEMAGIPALCIKEFEADDTMATIAKWAEKEKMQVFLCTTDKDLFQLVNNTTFVLNVHKDNLLIDAKKVEELFGVPPEKMLDLLSIMGDASDNIPGIKGFGPKTAVSLLKEFGTLDELLAHPEKVPGKKGELLIQQKDEALMSRKLATLQEDAPIPKDKAFYYVKEPDLEKLQAFYHEMKFLSLLKELPQEEKKEEELPVHYHLVEDLAVLKNLIENLSHEKEICLDTETTGLNPILAELVGVGLGIKKGEAFYIPLNGPMDREEVLASLRHLIEHTHSSFFGHNIKYDLHILKNAGLELSKISFDTILASYLLSPQSRLHGLDRLALEHFNKQKISIKSLIQKGKKEISMKEVPLDKVTEYCCEDVDYTFRLKELFEKDLLREKLDKILFDLEIPLIFVLAKMERKGMYVDKEKLLELQKEFSQELSRLEKEIYQETGKIFNINSPKQLSEILYKDLKLPPPKKKESEFSTSADVLEKLAAEAPFVKKILEFRTLQKLLTTYVEALPEAINPKTNRIHATFNQSITATGRLSCQNPNLQNIPVRSKEGIKIRHAFKPEKIGWSYLSADYSQIELRLLAHFSEDPELIKAFLHNEDVHAYTASLVFGIPLKDVTPRMRQEAKAVNFGILYGQGAFGLSQQLNISTKKAEEFITTYFHRYPKVHSYVEHVKESARKTLQATTLLGRKRPLPEITSQNFTIRSAAERLAINTPLQGTAADLIKLSMLAIDKAIEEKKLEGFMILQIHDELIFELPDHELPIFEKLVKEKMEKVFDLAVPLTVDIKIGKNWGEC